MIENLRAKRQAVEFDPDFGTASEAVDALRRGEISARELTSHVFARIERHNPRLNLFVTLAQEQAMQRAREADEARANGRSPGALHGLPIVVKDVFATAGIRTTAGSKQLESYVPTENAAAVERLVAAGAIVVGKTNLPEFAGDWQSSNAVAGTSNNPWDTTRTTGGSTGGGAAALAAGFGFLELGGDLAGSIRIPSHCCGVYGHRPSTGVVPLRGHIPPPPGVPPSPTDLPAAGPLARSAADLLLALEVLGGPDAPESTAYQWRLPPARHAQLRDYRIGYVLDDPFCPIDSEVAAVLSRAIEALRESGARLQEGWPAGVDPTRQYECYGSLLAAFLSQSLPDAAFEGMRKAAAAGVADPWVRGVTATHREWLRQSAFRLQSRAIWQEWFASFDVFLMPTTLVPAFPHDHRDMSQRTLVTSNGERPYTDLAKWAAFATLTGCPATTVPVGLTAGGLPVGLQILGPVYEDATPIDVASKMADLIGGFTPPPALPGESS